MNAEWWSWSSFFLGVIVALLPSALAFAWFAWRAPVMDEHGRKLSDDEKCGEQDKPTRNDHQCMHMPLPAGLRL